MKNKKECKCCMILAAFSYDKISYILTLGSKEF